MAEEPKLPPKAVEGGEAQKPAPAGGTASSGEGKAEGTSPGARAPAAPASPASPTAAKPGAGVPARPPATAKAPVKPEPWSSPLLNELQRRFSGAVSEATIFRKMPSITLAKDSLLPVCEFLRSDEGGAYTLLTDHTAVDYPKREKRFDVIYHLYSFKANDRLRLKVLLGESETIHSVVSVWPAANWLEREVYDMFGVRYEGHPDLRRILLPDEWTGHPLRKDYDILRQDEAWVRSNLGIESGQ